MHPEGIFIFNQHASYLTIDIANSLFNRNSNKPVVLMAGVINPRLHPLNAGIKIIKTVKYHKKSIFTRFGSWLLAFVHCAILLGFKYRRYKLLLFSNPPLITFLPFLVKNQYDALIFDVYPDALAGSGFIRSNSFLFRFWAKANVRFYQKASRVYTISEGMRALLSGYCAPDKIELINLWSSYPQGIIPKEDNEFLKKYNFQNKFIILFSGNMGRGSGLESMIKVAEKFSHDGDVLFLFVGDGWMVPDLKRQVAVENLTNCLFLPYQEASILNHSLSAAGLAVVTLPPSMSKSSIPNKTYTLIALGKPLLCISDPGSDLSRLVVNYGIGKSFTKEETGEIYDFICKVKTDADFASELSQSAINCSGAFTRKNAEKICV